MTGRAHVIVIGNEKGGSGKSTTAMHLIVALLRQGHGVGSLDLDARQGTLTRYLANRSARAAQQEGGLPLPTHLAIARGDSSDLAKASLDERTRFEAALGRLMREHDFVVIDCPGSDNFLGRLGHAHADTLITPLNDSFLDLDMLANVDGESLAIQRPGTYAEMVWDCRKQRALRDRGSIDWIVMRNRLSHLDARNKRDMVDILEKLAKRIGFRLLDGFGERVIFRELFLKGLTLLDLQGPRFGSLKLSHLAARQEVRNLVAGLRLPARLSEGAEAEVG
ncbi:MAG: AAA family ATPase [Proteobacteria bacterium]|nr:AAA family ATPase [Pseudomonadota bacterium]